MSSTDAPSSQRLLRSTILALCIAAVLLITCVLPAEYGVDPTGVGRVLGLTQMGEVKRALAEEAAANEEAMEDAEPAMAATEASAAPIDPAAERESFIGRLEAEMARHPLSEAADLYQFVFHAALGGAHAGVDAAAARAWLDREIESLGAPSSWPAPLREEPLLESLNPDGSLVRLNLRPYLASGGDLGELARAVAQSASEVEPSTERLAEYWEHVVYAAEVGRIRFDRAALTAFIAKQRAAGYPAVAHSARYTQAYAPAYRIVKRVLVPLGRPST